MARSHSSEKNDTTPAPENILSTRIRPKPTSMIEALEPRVVCAVNIGAGLLSATALSNSQLNEIVNGLEDIGSLGDELEASGVLAQDIEGLGLSFGELFNFGTNNGNGGFLGDAFRDQIAALLAGTTVAQVNALLGTSPLAGTTGAYENVTWSLVQGGEYVGAHPLEWEVTITGKHATDNDLLPGADATAAGIAFTTAPKIATDASASFTFSFGLTDTDDFFATLGALTFNVAGAQPLLGMTGAAEYTVGASAYPFTLAAGSTVALGATFGNVAITGAGSADGKWTRPELSTLAGAFAATDFNVGATTDNGLHAKIRLATAGGTPVQLLLDDDAVLDATAPTVDHDVALVDYVAGGNVTGVFQRIQDVGALLDANPLRDLKLPGIGTAIEALDDLPAFNDLLALRNTANTYMTTVATPTMNGLATQLNSFLTTQLATAGITLSTFDLATEFDPATSSMLLKFTVDTGDLTKTFDFDRLGSAAAQAGISFGRDQNFQLDATFRAQGDFGFGFDLAQPAASAQSVFFTSGGIAATVDFDVADFDLAATLGPVTADIENGEIHASATLALAITDAMGDGRYTLEELNTAGEVTFGLTPTGTFAAELPLDIQLAGATFVNPKLRVTSANIFTTLPTVDTTTANFDKLFNLGKVGPEAILDLIIAAGDWASNFRNAPVFDVNIPFLDADLGNAFDFGLLFTKNLRDNLQDDLSYVALRGDFASFTLAANAPLVLGDGDSAEPIVLPAATYATKAALVTALNTALGATSKFIAENHGDNGVRIAAKNANDTPDFSLLGATYLLKTIGFVPSSTAVTSEVTLPLDVPTNGKISADAQFQLSIDGAAPVTITLAKTSTDTNTDATALAADLDAALTAHGIDAVAVGGKVKLVRADGKSFMVAGVPGTSFQQIGLESASAAGLTDAGSTLQTGLTYSTLTDMVPLLLTALGIDDGDADPTNDPIRARYDIATETIILHFQHSFLAPSITLPVGFEFDLSGWANLRTVGANPTLTLMPTLGGSFDLGIGLGNVNDFEELAITAPVGFAPNGYGTKADGSPDSNNANVWDGKLAADAVFKISFDDGVERTLTIAAADTTTNTTAANLLTDVKAAIALVPGLAGKLDARLIAKSGGTSDRIEFFTLEQTGSFQLRDLHVVRTSTTETMGFEADQLAINTAPSVAAVGQSQATLDVSPATDVTFTIALDGGAPVTITATTASMAGNTTMADLLADLNAAIAGTSLAGHVKATRYGAGTQMQFLAEDGARQMSVTAVSTAAQTTLNFGADPIVTRSRGGEFFIDNASLDASATLALSDFDLAAQIGFIGITTTGLAGSVTIDVGVELIDGTRTQFELTEIIDRISDGTIGEIVDATFTGSATATMSGLHIDAGLLSVGASADVVLTGTDIFNAGGPTFAVSFNGFDPTKLLNFSNASWQEIYEGVKLGVEFLTKTEQFSFLGNTKIPLINLSVSEIFTYTDQLVAAINELENNPAGALDAVEARIEELLGIPDENFDLTLEDGSIVKIHLGISTSFSASYGLDFDLATLASYTNGVIPADLLSLGGFLDASAEGSLIFGAYAGLSLDIGLDFSAGATPSLVLYDTSGVDLGLRVTGQNLNITASFGPAGFQIVDGSVNFDKDGLFDDDNGNGIEDNLENDGEPLVPRPLDTWTDDDLQDNDFATVHFGPVNTITDLPAAISAIAGGTPLSTYFGPTFSGKIIATLPGAITSDIGSIDLPGPIVITVPDVTKLFSSNPLVRKDSVQLTLPSFDGLLPEIPGLIQLLRDPAILLDGVDSGLGLISRLLSGKTATKLPLIGDQLRAGSGFIEEFRSGFIADLTAKLRGAGDTMLATLQQGMFDLFAKDTEGAVGLALGILKDYNGVGGVTVDDIVLTFRKLDGTIWVEGTDAPQLQDAVQFNLHLGQGITFGTNLDIDWGLPGLDLDITGSPSITAGWELFLGFGVSVTDFFYLDGAPPANFTGAGATLAAGTSVAHELRLGFDAVLTSDPNTPFVATGRLFFLQLDAADKLVDPDGAGPLPEKYSSVGGAFYVDLTDPGAGTVGRVTVKELFSRGTVKPITAGVEAIADVNLELTASVGGNTAIPRLLADFSLDWTFQLGQPVTAPTAAFTNVNLDLGSFVSDFLKPIVKQVNDVIKPFDPVLDALQTRIPVLSDIMGRNYTVLDLAVQFGNVDRRFIDAALQIRSLVADIAAVPDGESILIPLGDLAGLGSALMTKDGAKNVNTSSAGTTAVSFPAGASASKNAFMKSTSVSGGGFGFPILKPAEAFKLLLGQDATLITYDIPRLTVGMSMSQKFRIWGPLVGKFSGNISAYADFAVGFDTKGFNTYRTSGDVVDILDGFFVSDRANADGTGADVYEAGFFGRIGIAGAIDAAIIEAGIEGFFELRADLDLKDPNNDGKVRGSEMIALLTHPNGYGPLNLGSIRLRGDVGARAYVDFWAPFGWHNAWEWEFARVTLFDKTFSAPDVTPDLGTKAGSTLTLNAGPSANQRDFISTSDVGEEFRVTGTGNNITVTFTNTGTSQSFSGVDRIVLNGGKGDDRLIVGAGVTTAITFNGGEGDDYFEGGAGDDIIIGGTGNDTLIGNGGANTLDGGDGADTITGGAGADIIIGGLGDDTLNGGGGADTYKFANDWGNDFFDGTQTGSGAFDFSAVTKDLTLNISATGAQGSSGNNAISFDSTAPYITSVKGGSGNDVATIAATGASVVSVDGNGGNDQYIVSFGRLVTPISIADTGTGLNDSDTVTVRPLSRDYTIDVGDLYVSGVKGVAPAQRANFTGGIENLTVDAKANGGSIVQIAEAISLPGEVRLLARQAVIGNTIDAGEVRVESTQAVNIAANVNAHANGNVTVLVNSGNIVITEDVMSSSGPGFTGDGTGLVHLFTSGGAILTGGTALDPGKVLASEGSLLLRGTNGSIGTLATPIYSTVSILAANTTGTGFVNVRESDGVTIGTIASIEGVKTTGGTFNVFNDAGELRVASPIALGGGDGTLTSDSIEIDADISSPGGAIFLRPEGDLTVMSVGNNVSGTFSLDQSEINHLVNGLASIRIGQPTGRNLINVGDANFTDPVLLQNPVLGGHVNQTGVVTITDGGSFTILGSGHTTELDNQNVAGNIDIIDSAVVRQGESVTLTSSGGAININFDLDGTAGGADETLILNALNDVTIKGAIGSVAQLSTLQITGAANIRFEGSVNVKHLILAAGATFTVDGTLTAEDIQMTGVSAATFHSGVSLSANFTASGSTLTSAVFEGQLSAPAVTIVAKQLVDFYQQVDVTAGLSVQTTNASGDIVFRQQVNSHTSDITVRSLDDITFIGPVAGDDLTVTSADAFAMQASTTLTGALTQIAGTGTSTFTQLTAASLNVTSAGVLLGGITTLNGAAGLVVNVGSGAFSAANAVSAPLGPVNVTARTITFQGTVAADASTLAATESITVANSSSFTLTNALSAATTSATLGEIKFTGPVDVGTTATFNTPRGLTFQNSLEVDGGLTVQAASSAQYQGAVTVGGVFTQQAGVTGAASFSSSVQAGSLALQAASLAFTGDVVSLGAANLAANTGGLTASGNVTVAGLLTANAATSLALNGATTAHAMSLTAANSVTTAAGGLSTAASPTSGDIQITTTATGNSVTLNGPVNAKGALAITSRSIGFQSTVTANAAALNATESITASNASSFTIATALNAATTSSSIGEIKFTGPVDVGTTATFNTPRGLTFQNSLEVDGALTVQAASSAQYQGTVAVGGVFTQQVGVLGATTFSASLQAGSLALQSGAFTFNGEVTSSGAAGLTANTGAITAAGNVSAAGALTATAATTLALNGATAAHAMALAATNTVTVGAGGLTTLASPTTGHITITTTGAVAGNSVTLNGPVDAKGTFAINAARGVLGSANINASALNVVSARSVSLNLVDAGSINLDAQSINLPAAVAATGAITLRAEAAGNIVVGSTLSAGSALQITRGKAITTSGLVTADSVAIGQGADSIETVSIGVGGMTATNDLRIRTTVAGTGNGITTLGPLVAGNAATLALDSARSVDVSGSIGTGDLTVASTSITLRSAVNAAHDATLTSAGNVAVNADLVAGATVAVTQASALSFGAKLTAQNLAVSNTGNATFTGQVALSGTANLTLTGDLSTNASFTAATSIAVNSVRDVSFGGLVSSATISLGSTNARTITVNAAGVSATGALTLRSTDAAGALNLNGPLTATNGAVTLSALGAVTATAAINGDSIGIASSAISLSGPLNADAGDIALNSTTAGVGNILASGVITSSGSLNIGATNAPLSTTLNSALNIGQDLIVRSAGTISTGAQVTVARDAFLQTTSAVTGEVRVNGALTTGRDLTLNTPRNATFLAPVTVGGGATIVNAAALQFAAALNVTDALTQLAGTTSARFASISAAAISVTSPTIVVTNGVVATTGAVLFSADSAGAVNVGGTTTAAGTLSIPSGSVITLTGSVSALSGAIAGGTFVAGGDVTATTGGLAFTTSGDISIAGKTTVAQTLSLLGSDDVTLTGAVSARDFALSAASFLAGGAFTTNVGDADFATTGNIRIVGLASVAQNLTVANALNTTFQGQVAVVGALTQTNGGGATRFEGATTAASMNVRSAQNIFAGSTFRATAGDIRLEADEIDFVGGTNAVQGAGDLTLRPYLAGTSIDIGSPTPTGVLDLSDTDINALQDRFTQITIGRAEDGTGAMLIGSSTFKDNVAFHAGSITIESNPLVGQVVTTLESLAFTARTGSIVANDDVFGTDATLTARDHITINNKVEVADFIVLTAGTGGTGSIILNGALATSAAGGTFDATAGVNGGNITITGTISTFDAEFTAESGAISQTAGNTRASELQALAESGITLLTTADHISARVSAAGDLSLRDTNPNAAHFLNLGSQSDVNDGLFTADGDITLIADQNVNAYRVQANGAVTIESGGEVYVDNVIGAPVSVTGTILIDEDRTTNGEQIRFDGNLRLLRDITLTSNGGDIIITGRVNGTAGQHYGLTFNAGGGNVTVGGAIGGTTPLEFLQVNEAGGFSLGGGVRVEDGIEIHADSVSLSAPKGSIVTTAGGEIRLLPNDGAAAIDIGGPAGGTAEFSLSDVEIAALGDGFSGIHIGQQGGAHEVRIESVRFLDDLTINGDAITLLTSSVTQGVNGISLVNGADDNDLTINAQTAFTQGKRAALTAGRNGNIAITADTIALDANSRGLVRGFGELLLQPFTPTQSITLGGTGAGFDLTATEFGALGDTFSRVTIGRADGEHAISVTGNLSLRDSTVIRTPLPGGSVTIGSGAASIGLGTVGRATDLRIEAGGNIIIDGNVQTRGGGALELLADIDRDGEGDLLVGQNLAKTNRSVTIGSEFGAIRMQGENIALGAILPRANTGIAKIVSRTGDITMSTNLDGDADGGITFPHRGNVVNTLGSVKLEGANHGGLAEFGAGIIRGTRGVEMSGFEAITTNATKIVSSGNVLIEALRETLKTNSVIRSLAEIRIFGDAATGVLAIEPRALISAKTSILLDAADVRVDPTARVLARTVTTNEL